MPRKQRIEYPGAVYHVISRGNYRMDLFAHANTAEAFERTIFEAVERCGWRLYAYVIMSNHYHLAIETPEPNLVTGMRWLQSIRQLPDHQIQPVSQRARPCLPRTV